MNIWLASVVLVAAIGTLYSVHAQSCNSCNCQFNNVQVLNQLVEAQVNRALAAEPCKLSSKHICY